MPGEIIHTNEVMVLLGDNWFAERSAKQACEIIDRRKKRKCSWPTTTKKGKGDLCALCLPDFVKYYEYDLKLVVTSVCILLVCCVKTLYWM